MLFTTRTWLWIWQGAALLISAIALFTPGSTEPSPLSGFDKIGHAGMFTLLTVPALLLGFRIANVVALACAYALVSEVIQAFAIPLRTGSVGDLVADGLGIGLAVAIWWNLPAHEDHIQLPD